MTMGNGYLDKFDPRVWQEALKENVLEELIQPVTKNMTQDIAIDKFDMHTVDGAHELLTNTTIKLVTGMRYGLVGLNGVGKTTLLRRISRCDIPEFPHHVCVLHVEQEIVGDACTVVEYVLKSDIVRQHFVEKEQERSDMQKSGNESEAIAAEYVDVLERMKELDVWTGQTRASEILTGLGFSKEMQERPTKFLSGGWRMRFNDKRASMVQSRIKTLKAMEKLEAVEDDSVFTMTFPTVGKLDKPIVQVDNLVFGYTHKTILLDNINILIDCHSRICFMGANGSGKSTLLKLIKGDLAPIRGDVMVNRNARIAYFTHHVDQLDLSLSPLGIFCAMRVLNGTIILIKTCFLKKKK
eukprot:203371_1